MSLTDTSYGLTTSQDPAIDPTTMPIALVTGATGFIGSHLVRALIARGNRVRCLVRANSRLGSLAAHQVEFVTADLDDAADLRRVVRDCDVVYHLAGRTSAMRPADLYRTNGWGSYALARACAQRNTPPHLILVSSLAAAGTGVAGRLRTERDPIRPISDYGRSKRAGEIAVRAWARQVPISIVRPGIVFGPGNREMLPMFQSIARFRVHAIPGFSTRRVALIHNDDLLDILLRVAEHRSIIRPTDTRHPDADDRATGYYFAAAPEFPTYAQLGRMIAQAVDVHGSLLVHIPEPIAWLAAAGNQWVNQWRGRTDAFNVDKMREAFAGHWTPCVDRLRQELGFVPPYSLQERLNMTARWYREHQWI